MLGAISDGELVASLERLRRSERETTFEILKHLNEMECRKLHLRFGYSSLFTYCTGHLRYSESAAGRRVQAARCLRQFPKVAPLLECGDINLMTLGLVASILTESTADQLLDRIRGKTQREVEAIASTFRPPIKLRDRVQHVNVPAPAPRVATTPAQLAQPRLAVGNGTLFVNQAADSQTGSEKIPTVSSTVRKLYIQFMADEDFMDRYEEACALLSNKFAKPSFEAVFNELLVEFIAHHSPEQKQARRELRAAVSSQTTSSGAGRSAIPARTRDAVFLRDEARCTYVGPGGKRCGEKRHLQIDHMEPVARGGTNDASNLRLLCSRHNQLEADRIMGKTLMDGYRGGSRPTPG